ncbi:uncharacterized protein Z518_03114 [Rhinocladiella mackenziei CBS 650.93]|uniref:Sec1 family superfamily n=1 Tax=Rhinocladiella mackenziei CBS 650.93 TaxID=1442369 RepID=A0A0D2HDA1_9EURO|nr:uncharacterized protein Z518_03114 [Rhinocladiella mackenziei CBS 650.93]KIX08458.1 hypothetical protein Z518_03114 [Rhinocladiella mackenziei CBS 650.93]
MATSIIDIQRSIIIDTIRKISGRDWKVLILDEKSRRLVYNVTKEDDILNVNITNIEQIEDRRQTQADTDAIYLLSPLPHIVECLKADLSRKRYRQAHLIWTSQLPRPLGEELFRSESRARQIVESRALNAEYFPRESNLILFREPWSFHVLFHPACDPLVKSHLDDLTQKIVSICVSLGEYPLIRFYKPREHQRHAADVLCYHLASFVQSALDNYARDERNDFPPQNQTNRPRAVLVITDRSMDLMSPFVHELTYQAMAMDLLPIRDDEDKITYRNVIRRGQPDQEEKDVEIGEKDHLWVGHRHMHMKDLLVQLSEEFKKFQAKNPQFADNSDGQPASINTIKDMLAGLPEFQEGKEAFSLHIDMAEKCAKIFADHKLLDVVSVEQSLATGWDEDNKKPKNLADQLARLLDDDSVIHEDRVRLLILYILYRNGILRGDIEKLRCHGQLSPMDGEIIYNLITLGARIEKPLKDNTPIPPPLFTPRMRENTNSEEVSLSRFEPALRYLLEEQCQGTLDSNVFPPVKPHLNDPNSQMGLSQTSLRNTGKPTWAQTRSQSNKPRQRIIVFMAGGATYSEARACYDVSRMAGKEIFLATTHMITPKNFLRQVSLLSAGRRQLDLPTDRAQPKLPAWMSEPPPQGQQPRPQAPPNGRPPDSMRPPTEAMQKMNIGGRPENGVRPGVGTATPPMRTSQPSSSPYQNPSAADSHGKLKKEKKHLGLFKKH